MQRCECATSDKSGTGNPGNGTTINRNYESGNCGSRTGVSDESEYSGAHQRLVQICKSGGGAWMEGFELTLHVLGMLMQRSHGYDTSHMAV